MATNETNSVHAGNRRAKAVRLSEYVWAHRNGMAPERLADLVRELDVDSGWWEWLARSAGERKIDLHPETIEQTRTLILARCSAVTDLQPLDPFAGLPTY